jgi:hypothetical protein
VGFPRISPSLSAGPAEGRTRWLNPGCTLYARKQKTDRGQSGIGAQFVSFYFPLHETE